MESAAMYAAAVERMLAAMQDRRDVWQVTRSAEESRANIHFLRE